MIGEFDNDYYSYDRSGMKYNDDRQSYNKNKFTSHRQNRY